MGESNCVKMGASRGLNFGYSELGRVQRPTGWWGEVVRAVGECESDWFGEGLERVISNGRETLFWKEKWVGEVKLKDMFPRLFNFCLDKNGRVGDMGEWRGGLGCGIGDGDIIFGERAYFA